jgi:hypothetical protein
VRVLRHLDFSRLPPTTALTAGCCPVWVSPSGQPLTQEHSSQFFLAAPGIPSCATRRTLTPGSSSPPPCQLHRATRLRSPPSHFASTSSPSLPATSVDQNAKAYSTPPTAHGLLHLCYIPLVLGQTLQCIGQDTAQLSVGEGARCSQFSVEPIDFSLLLA